MFFLCLKNNFTPGPYWLQPRRWSEVWEGEAKEKRLVSNNRRIATAGTQPWLDGVKNWRSKFAMSGCRKQRSGWTLSLSNKRIHLLETENKSSAENVLEDKWAYLFQPQKENTSWRNDPKEEEIATREGKINHQISQHRQRENPQNGKHSHQDQCKDLGKVTILEKISTLTSVP